MTNLTPARKALANYANAVGTDESNIADLIADLALIADELHVLEECDGERGGAGQIARATTHYRAESEL